MNLGRRLPRFTRPSSGASPTECAQNCTPAWIAAAFPHLLLPIAHRGRTKKRPRQQSPHHQHCLGIISCIESAWDCTLGEGCRHLSFSSPAQLAPRVHETVPLGRLHRTKRASSACILRQGRTKPYPRQQLPRPKRDRSIASLIEGEQNRALSDTLLQHPVSGHQSEMEFNGDTIG